MSNDLENVRDMLDQNRHVFEENNMEVLGIFGSFARGEAGESSDIDILVTDAEGCNMSLGDIGFVENKLREVLGVEVDIVHAPSMEENASEQEKRRVKEEIVKV